MALVGRVIYLLYLNSVKQPPFKHRFLSVLIFIVLRKIIFNLTNLALYMYLLPLERITVLFYQKVGEDDVYDRVPTKEIK